MTTDEPESGRRRGLEEADTVGLGGGPGAAAETGRSGRGSPRRSADDTLLDESERGAPESHFEAAREAASAFDRSESPTFRRGDSVGRLTVLETLGQGGFGVVLAAYDPDLDRKVALKVLRAGVVGTANADKAKARLLREARAMAKLSHPHVVTVHDVGTVGDNVYIAMEHLGGGTLGAWLEKRTRTRQQIVALFLQAGRGLAAAHEAGLAHRDFKPANVLLDEKGTARVCDFGLVSTATGALEDEALAETASPRAPLDLTLTRTGEILGTPYYMAPEQHRGDAAGEKADQFAFCVALHEALYGTRPFAGSTYAELVSNVLAGKVTEPAKGADVPAWLRLILLRGLRLDPEHRYASMAALLADLERDPSAVRKRRIAAASLVAAFLALAGGLVFALTRTRDVRRDACADVGIQLQGVWDDERRADVERAFLATQHPDAAGALAHVDQALDRYAESWVKQQSLVCEALRARAGPESQSSHLRALCLAQRRDALAALVELLAVETDEHTVESAAEMALELPEIEQCMRDVIPSVASATPEDEAGRERLRSLRRKLARVAVLEGAGRYADGLELADAALEEALVLGDRSLEAQALYRVAALQQRSGRADRAEEDFRAAARVAEAVGEVRVCASAWISLISLVVNRRDRRGDVEEFASAARATLEKLGGDPLLESRLLEELGEVAYYDVEFARAGEYFERALALCEERRGPDDFQCVRHLENLGGILTSSNPVVAREYYEKALAVTERALGPRNRRVADVLFALSRTYDREGEYDAAERLRARATDIYTSTAGFVRDRDAGTAR